jgi:hypothetical protein
MPPVHFGKAPFVVGVKQDDVGFYAQHLKILQSSLVVREELRVESIKVEAAVPCLDVWEAWRFDMVKCHPFWKYQEANFVERALLKRIESPSLQVSVPIQPVVQRRAERKIWRPISIGEVVRVPYLDRTMIISAGRTHQESPRLATELFVVRQGYVGPFTLLLRHEANLPRMITVIEAVNFDRTTARTKATTNVNIGEWVSVSKIRLQRNFLPPPLFNALNLTDSLRGTTNDDQ